jgi:hypothetical protein
MHRWLPAQHRVARAKKTRPRVCARDLAHIAPSVASRLQTEAIDADEITRVGSTTVQHNFVPRAG